MICINRRIVYKLLFLVTEGRYFALQRNIIEVGGGNAIILNPKLEGARNLCATRKWKEIKISASLV